MKRLALGGAALLVLVACATGGGMGGPVLRPAADTPARFVLDRDAPSETLAGPGCRSPLFDPRDGTRVEMIRSAAGRADYAVPSGRYGTGAGELLRLDCRTGQPLGIVRR